jgi:hypothetical protein
MLMCLPRLVTPYSVLRYRVLDQNEFWRDRVLGEKTIQLYEVLNHYSGRCDQLELTLDLMHHHSSNGFNSTAAGELFIVLNGLQVDMANVPAPNSIAATPSTGEADAATTAQNRPRQLATISYFPSVPVAATAATSTPLPGTSTGEAAAGEATEPDANGGTSSAAGATTPGSAATPANGATSSIEEPLPQGWEMRYDIYGRRSEFCYLGC